MEENMDKINLDDFKLDFNEKDVQFLDSSSDGEMDTITITRTTVKFVTKVTCKVSCSCNCTASCTVFCG